MCALVPTYVNVQRPSIVGQTWQITSYAQLSNICWKKLVFDDAIDNDKSSGCLKKEIKKITVFKWILWRPFNWLEICSRLANDAKKKWKKNRREEDEDVCTVPWSNYSVAAIKTCACRRCSSMQIFIIWWQIAMFLVSNFMVASVVWTTNFRNAFCFCLFRYDGLTEMLNGIFINDLNRNNKIYINCKEKWNINMFWMHTCAIYSYWKMKNTFNYIFHWEMPSNWGYKTLFSWTNLGHQSYKANISWRK